MNIQKTNQLKENATKAADLLKAMANEKRLLILCQLLSGEKCVGELAQETHLSQSAISQHLSKLRSEHLVSTRKESQTVYYSIMNQNLISILEILRNNYCRED